MKKIVLFVFLLFPFFSLFSQRIEYKSRVFDGITYIPIAGANIYNVSSKNYCFSDKDGFFNIKVMANDTLIISKSIYKQTIIVLSEIELKRQIEEYYLYNKSILLKELVVYSLNPSYEVFKRELASKELPNIYDKMKGIGLSDEEKLRIDNQNTSGNLLRNTALSSPITALYNLFSKKVKAQRLYNEIVEYEQELDKIPDKYNRDIVANITGLTGEPLVEFMVFCRFSYYDIIRWSNEQVIQNVRSKYYEYEYVKALQDE